MCILSIFNFLGTETSRCLQSTLYDERTRYYQKSVLWVFLFRFLGTKILKCVKSIWHGETEHYEKRVIWEYFTLSVIKTPNMHGKHFILRNKNQKRVFWVFLRILFTKTLKSMKSPYMGKQIKINKNVSNTLLSFFHTKTFKCMQNTLYGQTE